MAGSYDHIAPPDGSWELIENMGDAYECVEELLWLVLSQIGNERAKHLIAHEYYPMYRLEKAPDEAFKEMRRRMENEDDDS